MVGLTLGISLGACVVGSAVGELVVGINGLMYRVGEVVGYAVVGNKLGLLEGASVTQAPQTPQPKFSRFGTSGTGTQMVSC